MEGEYPKEFLEVKLAGLWLWSAPSVCAELGTLYSLAQTCCTVQRGGGSGLQVTAGEPAGFPETGVFWD